MQFTEFEKGLLISIEKETTGTYEVVMKITELLKTKSYLSSSGDLLKYLITNFKYSETRARSRILAAKVAIEFPSILDQLKDGSLCISQVLNFKRALQEPQEDLPKQTKLNILKELEHKSVKETQKTLSQRLNLTIKERDRRTIQKDNSTRVEFTQSPQQAENLKQCELIASHAILEKYKALTTANLIDHIAKYYLKTSDKPSAAQGITDKRRKELILKAQSCEYIHKDGSRCHSQHLLEVDHVQPKYAGGTNHAENLRILCRAHNQWRYKQGR